MKKKKNNETVVYCGPNIRGIVRSFTSFIDGIVPNELARYAENCSAIGELIVPVTRLSEVNRQLKDPHSSLSVFYKIADNYIKTGGEK